MAPHDEKLQTAAQIIEELILRAGQNDRTPAALLGQASDWLSQARLAVPIDPAAPVAPVEDQGAELDKCFSTDGENFNHTELEGLLDALDADGQLEVGQVYYEADAIAITNQWLAEQLAHRTHDELDCILGDAIGEASEGLIGDFDRDALSKAMVPFVAQAMSGSRVWRVQNTVQRTVTAADIEQAAKAH